MRLLILLLIILTLAPLAAQEANFEFRPGRSLGTAQMGQTPEEMLEAFPGWTHGIDERTNGASYYFPKSEPSDFICGFTPEGVLNEITLNNRSIHMRKSPNIGPGCTMESVERKFGVPSTNTFDNEKFGGYWDYDHLGICFHFDGTSRDAPRHGPGNVDGITLYKPGASRFKR